MMEVYAPEWCAPLGNPRKFSMNVVTAQLPTQNVIIIAPPLEPRRRVLLPYLPVGLVPQRSDDHILRMSDAHQCRYTSFI
jgi:hypothetical protein